MARARWVERFPDCRDAAGAEWPGPVEEAGLVSGHHAARPKRVRRVPGAGKLAHAVSLRGRRGLSEWVLQRGPVHDDRWKALRRIVIRAARSPCLAGESRAVSPRDESLGGLRGLLPL